MAKKSTPNTSLSSVVAQSLKANFDVSAYKKGKYLGKSVAHKPQQWLPCSDAIRDVLSLPGIPLGHITLLRGRSDTGKTTLMVEAAISAQKMGKLPVFIITEMKWNWDHVQKMGFDITPIWDEVTGELLDYEGDFIYVDRSSLETIEDVAAFILALLNDQKDGKLPRDLVFFWDSIGSIPCRMSVENNNNNPMWNAGAYATQFGNFINQQFPLSRKVTSPYTNTLIVINKTGVMPPSSPMGQPQMTNKGGDTMFFDASLVITFGNVTNSGTSKLKAVKDGKNVDFAKKTKVAISKNHINDVTTNGTVIMVAEGFILDDKKVIDDYKKANKDNWFAGGGEVEYVEDNAEWNETGKIIPDTE